MANPIIKILRGAGAPPTLEAGRIAMDQLNKNLVVGIDDGNGGTINEIVGGSGTFATKQFVADSVTAATGSLGTMSTQNANSVAITGGSIDGTAIGDTTPSTGKFTTIKTGYVGTSEMGNLSVQSVLTGLVGDDLYVGSNIALITGANTIRGLAAPTSSDHAANKGYVDSAISALDSVFNYVGELDLSAGALVEGDFVAPTGVFATPKTGNYYRITGAGEFKWGGGSGIDNVIKLKIGDALVKTTTGWQKLDNVDVVVSGTTNEIVVTGDENTGYTVAIDPLFSGRILMTEGDIMGLKTRATDLETKTQNIDLAGTSAGTTKVNGKVEIAHGPYTTTFYDNSGGITTTSPIGIVSSEGIYVDKIQPFNGNLTLVGYSDPITIDAPILKGRVAGTTTTLEDFVIDGGTY